MNKEILESILDKAVLAPSGENIQPWRFEVTEDFQLFLIAVTSGDDSVFNFGNKSVLIAIGALVENIAIISSSYGFKAGVHVLSKFDNENYIAKISFTSIPAKKHTLENYIMTRHSNREHYLPAYIPLSFIDSVQNKEETDRGVQVCLSTNKGEIQKISKALSVNDFLILNNTSQLTFLLKHIIWSKKDTRKRKVGFYLSTLGLSFFERVGLYLIRVPFFEGLQRKLGIPNLVARSTAKKIATASLIGCISIQENTPATLIEAGRTLQRIWLMASKEGYAFQVFGVPMLFDVVSSSNHDTTFNELERELIKKMYSDFQGIYNPTYKNIVMLFRIGKENSIPEVNVRMRPNISYI